MDDLTCLIAEELNIGPARFDDVSTMEITAKAVSAAVRAHLVSDEVVERLALAIEREGGYVGNDLARAVLTAAIGEDG